MIEKKMHETATQSIFRKYNELRWLDFVEWLDANKQQMLDKDKQTIELAHFHGSMRNGFSTDYYRERYEDIMDNIKIVRACVNQKWYHRLYYRGEMINDFFTPEEAENYARKHYDRTTDTIKKNQAA